MPYTIEKSSKWMIRSQPHRQFYDASGCFELVHIWQFGRTMIMKWRKITHVEAHQPDTRSAEFDYLKYNGVDPNETGR